MEGLKKETISKRKYDYSGKVKCECGTMVQQWNLYRHRTSKKHKKKLLLVEPETCPCCLKIHQ
jgi:hypothetical protein